MSIPRYHTFDESPRAPTPTAGDNSTKVATTAFVQAATSPPLSGTGSPEGAVTAAVGRLYVQTDAATAIDGLWYKKTGAGNTGWVQVVASTAIARSGTGSPEGAVTSAVGGLYVQTDAATAMDGVWYKQSGSGNTGWVQIAASSGSGGGGGSAVVASTVAATSSQSNTGSGAFQDIKDSAGTGALSVSITPSAVSMLMVTLTIQYKPTDGGAWDYNEFRSVLDGATNSTGFKESIDQNGTVSGFGPSPSNPVRVRTFHWCFTGVSAAAHTVKAQWSDAGSNQDVTYTHRRLTVIAIPT